MIFRCVFRPYFIILSHDYSIVHTFLSSICCMVYLIKSRFLRISTVKRKLFHYTTYNAHITSQYLLSTRFFNFSSSFFFCWAVSFVISFDIRRQRWHFQRVNVGKCIVNVVYYIYLCVVFHFSTFALSPFITRFWYITVY